MGLIEKSKTYTGRDLETIFFRPMFAGQNAEQLGIRVMYNMPVPTTIQMWSPNSDVLKAYSSGWTGGDSASRVQKSIEMSKLKAEVGFSASDYFQSVYELITGRADVNLDDLTGSELEQAETEMFRAAITESLRVMMWLGDTNADRNNLFDGLLKLIDSYTAVRTLHLVAHLVHSEELAVHVSCTSCRAVIVVTGKVDVYESRARSEKHRFLVMVVL